jgi:hypothetical protein
MVSLGSIEERILAAKVHSSSRCDPLPDLTAEVGVFTWTPYKMHAAKQKESPSGQRKLTKSGPLLDHPTSTHILLLLQGSIRLGLQASLSVCCVEPSLPSPSLSPSPVELEISF